MDTIKVQTGSTLMVAHRGVSGLETENTCSAFVAAGNRSYFGIETDVYRTLDGHFVCMHDHVTARVAIDALEVEKSTFDALRSLVLLDRDGKRSRADLRIPTLREYLRICKKYGKTGVLELKSDFTAPEIESIVDIIREEDYINGIIFIAFNLNNLLLVRQLLPGQTCQYLTDSFPDSLPDTLTQNHLDLDIYYQALTKEKLDALHARGVRVNVWTVDKPEDAERLAGWGVDYITSNILEGARG